MIVQCAACQKKYKLKAENLPLEGARIKCSGPCGQSILVAPRDNLASDASAIPVNKRKHKKEVKWFGRMAGLIKSLGYERKTKEFNLMFYFLRELRKRQGITFFDISCTTALKSYDRELKYNCLMFMGKCCVPPWLDSLPSCVPDIILSLSQAYRAHDSAGEFSVSKVMAVPYEDSFPTVFSFLYGVPFVASWGEELYGNVTEVLISSDAVREIDEDFDFSRLHEVARVEVSRAPIDNGNLPFKTKIAPNLILNPDPDPEFRTSEKAVVLDLIAAKQKSG